jgi:hypothetical protein
LVKLTETATNCFGLDPAIQSQDDKKKLQNVPFDASFDPILVEFAPY